MSKKNNIKFNFFEDRTLENLEDAIDSERRIIPIIDGFDLDNSVSPLIPDFIPIIALRSTVLFPGAVTPVTVGRKKSIKLIKEIDKRKGILGTLLQKDSSVKDPEYKDLYTVGTAARILKVLEMPNGNLTVILHGLEKFKVKEFVGSEPYFKATIVPLKEDDWVEESPELDAIIESIKEVTLKIVETSPIIPQEVVYAIKNIYSKQGIINFISSNVYLPDQERQELLETLNLMERAKLLLELLIKHAQFIDLKNEIQGKVRDEVDKQQREYFLHQTLRTIQEEIQGDDGKPNAEMRKRAKKKKWSKEVGELFEKELQRLERMNQSMSDYSVQLNYLELLLELPWNKYTKDNTDLQRAKKYLDADHFGLDDVKDRILEHLAVLKLKGDFKSPILCLYGAPGVGKTSLGKSVAKSLGRKFGRISLGGLHDESEIRGHRKTYIGAMPGRIMKTISKTASSNPVIILDEIDKVSRSNQGDPASALLEVLDPEQNGTFYDNYIDIEYDLSKVLFIATANNISNISPALRDRMEMINVSGYIIEEKIEIAKKHLLPKQLKAHGVLPKQLKLTDSIIEKIIAEYTRESGVRLLDKFLAKTVRYRAKNIGLEETYNVTLTIEDIENIMGIPRYSVDKQDEKENIGIVTGLAWTEVGGAILYIESSLNKGKGNMILTGNLGEVMKESASIAFGWVKSNAEKLGIDYTKIEQNDIHIHVPEGAIPKDGPSAGITMVTAITSVFAQKKVKARVAMTGETTLRGKVLPVGGIKEKILAAKRSGVTDIILSKENKKDIVEIKEQYIAGLTFHYVSNVEEVLDIALL